MTVPEASVCPTCDGEESLYAFTTDGRGHQTEEEWPCPDCRCICGGPYGHRCELLDDIDDDYRHKVTEGSR